MPAEKSNHMKKKTVSNLQHSCWEKSNNNENLSMTGEAGVFQVTASQRSSMCDPVLWDTRYALPMTNKIVYVPFPQIYPFSSPTHVLLLPSRIKYIYHLPCAKLFPI